MLWTTFPDGKGDFFLRSGDDPNVYAGPEPWYAVIRPELAMINVATRPSYRGRPCEYGFVNGYLRFASEGGKEREVAIPPSPAPTGTARGFWPTAATVAELRKKNDMWKDGGRLRFISRNPNRTALFLAQLGLVALGVALFAKGGIWRLHGVLWTLVFLVLQFQALSRGGILAFISGAVLTVYFRLRGRRRLKTIALAVAGALTLLGVTLFVYRNRLTQEVGADSSQSRIAIWREVPRMIAAAPQGWGLWQSGEAYNSWFEKPGRCHLIGDLFNDHLSRLVEGGFGWGGLYVFAWCLVFCVGWRWARRGGSPTFLAVWVAYFVASSFNPMNYWSKSFWVPGALSAVWLAAVLRRCSAFPKPSVRHEAGRVIGWSLALTAFALTVTGVAVWLAPQQDVPLHVSAQGRRVIVGSGEPSVWVVDDGFVLNGNFNGYPGREIRAYWKSHRKMEPLGIVKNVSELPAETDRLVLTGTSGEDFLKMADPPKAKHLVFLTPPFASDKIPQTLRGTCDVHLVTGHFVARLTGDAARQERWIHVKPGACVYVPGWLDIVWKELRDAS